MAMHPCLSIPELVSLIVAEVDDKPSLIELARVSRIFNDPALDILYANIPCFADFLRCLPADLWAVEADTAAAVGRCRAYSRRLVFKRAMKQSDWDVFLPYAARVRTIAHQYCPFRGFGFARPAPEVYRALRRNPIRAPIFPRLRGLSLADAADLPIVLFAPELRHLDVACTISTLLYHVPNLARVCPRLAALDCAVSDMGTPHYQVSTQPNSQTTGQGDMTQAISKVLGTWQNLRVLSVGPVSRASLEHIARLPSFDSLSLSLPSGTPWLFDGGAPLGIRDLGSLTLHGAESFEDCATALHVLFGTESPHPLPARLSRISVSAKSTDASSLAIFSDTLARHVSHTHLVKLFVYDHATLDYDNASHSIADGLRPLLAFSALEGLDLMTRRVNGAPLIPDVLVECAKAWPRLKRMHIPALRPSLPLRSLVSVLGACPELESLYLDVEVPRESVHALLEEWERDPRRMVQNARILTLRIGRSSLISEDVASAAKLYGLMLPGLMRVIASPSKQQDLWGEVLVRM